MSPEAARLAEFVSHETGLPFQGTEGSDADGHRWVLLSPAGEDVNHAFAIRLTLGWRRLSLEMEPGKFAAPLLAEMSHTDDAGLAVFSATFRACADAGAELTLRVNGVDAHPEKPSVWQAEWRRFEFSLKKGNVEIGDGDYPHDLKIALPWVLRFSAAVISLMPLESMEETPPDNQQGFPEGAKTSVTVNRYERDRRNRAAAIAIHGCQCLACGFDFGSHYGDIALGFIEVHHTVPVSKMKAGYVVDPASDLAPLCSNCHSVVHRTDPPLTIESLRELLRITRTCHER